MAWLHMKRAALIKNENRRIKMWRGCKLSYPKHYSQSLAKHKHLYQQQLAWIYDCWKSGKSYSGRNGYQVLLSDIVELSRLRKELGLI